MKRATILLWLLAGAPWPAQAAFDTFLCVPAPSSSGPQQIPGESLDSEFRDCIDVVSGAETAFLDDAGAQPRDLRFAKRIDAASVPLRRALVNQTLLPSSTFHFRKAGVSGEVVFWTIRLVNARVTSISSTFNSGDDVPSETVSLRAARIETTYHKVKPDGTLGSAVVTCWDVAAGTSSNGPCP